MFLQYKKMQVGRTAKIPLHDFAANAIPTTDCCTRVKKKKHLRDGDIKQKRKQGRPPKA